MIEVVESLLAVSVLAFVSLFLLFQVGDLNIPKEFFDVE